MSDNLNYDDLLEYIEVIIRAHKSLFDTFSFEEVVIYEDYNMDGRSPKWISKNVRGLKKSESQIRRIIKKCDGYIKNYLMEFYGEEKYEKLPNYKEILKRL